MVDILNECVGFAEDNSQIIDDLGLSPGGYRLVTFHRAENTDQASKLKSIVQALIEIGKSEEVILPCHPRTENRLKMEGLWKPLVRGVRVVKPVGYTDMLVLEKNAFGILTDSGGVQKEAYLLGVACVTMRQTTEWVETVDDGWNILVGTDTEKIVWAARNFRPRRLQRNVFGDGTASQRIMDVLRVLDQIV